jgi:hypothetical protein
VGYEDPPFLCLGISWSCQIHAPVVFSLAKASPRLYLLGGPQGMTERFREVKTLDPMGTRTPISRSSSKQPITIPIELWTCRPRETHECWKTRGRETRQGVGCSADRGDTVLHFFHTRKEWLPKYFLLISREQMCLATN